MGSTDVDLYLTGLRADNDLALDDAMFDNNRPLMSIWIGNRTVATAHFDMTHNLVCAWWAGVVSVSFRRSRSTTCIRGHSTRHLAGRLSAWWIFSAPDFERHPRFREALAAGQVAELEPGDVLFYPAMWWHHVQALESFNAMINYWWTTSPSFMDSPQTTMLHALISLRDRPPQEKAAWRALFDYYVFGAPERAAEHLPEHARGNLAPMDDAKARRLRAFLISRLNR